MFITHLIEFALDALILSVIGYAFGRIVNANIKYKKVFNISIYSLTLPIVLLLVYTLINIFTGFMIRRFDIAFNVISYIYIATAILMIKSDLIRQQIEVGKIVAEQKKIRDNKEAEEDNEKNNVEDKEKKENHNNNNEKKKKKEKSEDDKESPEGNEA